MRARVCLRPPGHRKVIEGKPLTAYLNDGKVKSIFQEQQEMQLINHKSDVYLDVPCRDIQTAVIYTSILNPQIKKHQWISVAHTELIDA